MATLWALPCHQLELVYLWYFRLWNSIFWLVPLAFHIPYSLPLTKPFWPHQHIWPLLFSSRFLVSFCFYCFSHSFSHFSLSLGPASHLILIPTSMPNSFTFPLFPCTCPANPQAQIDFSICFLLPCSQAAELSSGKSPHRADYTRD